ncbi:Enoyl-CoA hydratase/carnithine racemase [Desulfocicer vacuolatum DSM 3385]|uniref:Enoyl-CoA hydratase/carnithine racemase n=1 Tax=Desulfocicer vacuolatum DSM 3385 TaxID=1121400 RepID=A0A1W2C2B0_9BACT|nr:enoyl-CoA hydratase/isomerase family protein [Desulfocicer vacuolatum]SMC79154.1 Enoyl-CoA hydratase/carnithine racemase [Desulfocicer vacuolatum DSM 3385]
MAIANWKKEGTVAVVTLSNGANLQNLDFSTRLNEIFDEVLADDGVYALVLTSDDVKNFSQGVDIEWLGQRLQENDFDAMKAFMYTTNRVFKRLLQMPIPTIAAINGHAFGNGAMLACACDFRFMKRDRGFFCFPEVDISIPFLPGMIAFVRKAIPEYKFNELKLTGKRVGADEMEVHHIIEKASANVEELMSDALGFAATFHKKRGIFGEHKKRMHKAIIEVMEKEDAVFIETLDLFIKE